MLSRRDLFRGRWHGDEEAREARETRETLDPGPFPEKATRPALPPDFSPALIRAQARYGLGLDVDKMTPEEIEAAVAEAFWKQPPPEADAAEEDPRDA